MDSNVSSHNPGSHKLHGSHSLRTASLQSASPHIDGCSLERAAPFCIDRWLVQPQSNELRCLDSSERRSLEPRLMRLLCLLAAAPQHVFSRDELMAHLWPRVIVNENSLTRAISDLRKQLGRDGRNDKLIETIPKTGYRLSATCQLQDPATASTKYVSLPRVGTRSVVTDGFRFDIMSFPGMAAAASLTLGAILLVLLQLQGSRLPQQDTTGIALADINLSSQAAFDALIAGRLETVSAKTSVNSNAGVLTEIGSLGATQPVVSRDGGLFAYIHYNEQGSSLVLGSTQLPSSPVTIFTTQDTIYNLQWSPVDRALLFAQAPKLTPAALVPMDNQASLVMFDLESFTTRVIDGPAVEAGDIAESEELRSFKLTALGRSFDWLS
ncbi:MAG: transcriptional regulator [Gammaproteobacteria bacterium]|nr:transcriptional regulator [Gammaproteobacteria bacterium]MDP2139438.1 transcriptional regulator [Gammaproteobacteria bacterium]MDP2346274.1 transcriptional regulator [Gammaproteobacteria bacterium]